MVVLTFCNCAKNPNFANCRFSFRKLQIFILQTTDSHFANYRFSFRKLQILISQTTDFHFVSFHFVSFCFVSLHFVSQTMVSPLSVLSGTLPIVGGGVLPILPIYSREAPPRRGIFFRLLVRKRDYEISLWQYMKG